MIRSILCAAAAVFCVNSAGATNYSIDFLGVDPFDLPLENQRGDFGEATVTYRTLPPLALNPAWGDVATFDPDIWIVAPATGFSDLDAAAFAYSPGFRGEIKITATETDKRVGIFSFDLGAFFATTGTWHIYDLDYHQIAEGSTPVKGAGEAHSTLFPLVYASDGIILQWGNSAYDVGINNIEFFVLSPGDVAPIPLPGSDVLYLGAIALFWPLTRRAGGPRGHRLRRLALA